MSKANVNWLQIKVRWEAGHTSSALAREYPVSRQGIDKRAKKEGWERKSTDSPANWLKKAEGTYIAASGSSDKRTPEVVATILDNISHGVPQGMAAKAAGISPGTLTNWKREDPELKRLIRMAGSQAAATYVQRIHKAGERDWKADKYLLENHPEAAEDYGQKSKGSGPLIVNFGFEPKFKPLVIDGVLVGHPKTIDGETVEPTNDAPQLTEEASADED